MNPNKMAVAFKEAERFMQKIIDLQILINADNAQVAEDRAKGNPYVFRSTFPKEHGAVKRASMDLTRALADLRKPG